ncbi:hypothetical protein [Oligoflexus tunisiensis]|uniref:hypothetical protein n=1 Tax=Oligoflexus tunisiensis TaxID=708132 RepID=UPI00114D2B0E|nr:hypothetical protein [Oligoflexus tunisiensis]
MIKYQKKEIVAGIILLFSAAQEKALAREGLVYGDDDLSEESAASVLDQGGPNILEMMLQDNEQVTPPTPVNGGYLTGLVVQQKIQANWLKSEVGLQIILDGEKLDPRRFQVEWRIVSNQGPAVKAALIDANDFDFGQRIQIETPLNMLYGPRLANIEIEARIVDREQPDRAPLVVVQTLSEMIANGRDGL